MPANYKVFLVLGFMGPHEERTVRPLGAPNLVCLWLCPGAMVLPLSSDGIVAKEVDDLCLIAKPLPNLNVCILIPPLR